ncbi:MAG TPA: quinolinate synthase NadA, partial [Dehalococcoidia bacterium]|nr:quinolinate synthase NadA [Dehalococcoidia bacterium]
MASPTDSIIPISSVSTATSGIACETSTGITTMPLSSEASFAYWQQDIPKQYWDLDAQQLIDRVAAARDKLGTRLIVLGHHYQREDIIQFADFRGDSFKLSQWAAEHPESEYIVFCGVHFMAEAADILSGPHQRVMLPNMAAGCSMADMADPEDVYSAWEELEEAGVADRVVPVTYMNSAASLKAFCGKHGGAVCTSSNADVALEWAFAQKGPDAKVLFFPDQHLGR